MSYLDLFLQAADHVRWRGEEVELRQGPPVREETLQEARL